MRLFVSLPLPEEVRRHLAGVAQTLRRANEPALEGVRWVPSENLHITLKFLGEIKDRDIPQVVTALESVEIPSPILMRAERLALQPKRGPARLIATDIGGDTGAMQRLHESIDQAMAGIGFAVERRGFWPHATLGRSRYGIEIESLAGTYGEIEWLSRTTWPGPFGEMRRIELVSSVLRPDGPVYSTVATFGR
jgi:2'-5' RNA ligase